MAKRENLKTKYGAIYDILDIQTTEKTKSIFHTYKNKSEIGAKIFRELYRKFQSEKKLGPTWKPML